MVFENRVPWHCQEQPPQNYIHLTEESKKMLLVTEWISFKTISWEFVDLATQKALTCRYHMYLLLNLQMIAKWKLLGETENPIALHADSFVGKSKAWISF